MVDANKTYVGVVEDNNDPRKSGRVRVRVMDVFDDIPVSDIPWAMPWKDLNGNSFNIPEVGKVVMVVFDQGKQDSPEFIYADHYNINLENKLKSLSESDYNTMKSVIFDNKTQIYVNDGEGLKIDHKFNNINIKDVGIDLNLKDNNRNLNLGDASANQQAILGNHWMDWFDEFVANMLGTKGGPFIGNLLAPVIPNPALIECLLKYKSLRDPVFLSHHVNIVDNNSVKTVSTETRENVSQIGDKWTSTKEENVLTKAGDEEDFAPVEGEKNKADDQNPVLGVTASSEDLTSENGADSRVTKLIKFMKSKNYVVYEDFNILNMVAMRSKDDGVITNKFDEILYIFWRKENGNWEIVNYDITTVPGYIPNGDTNVLSENVRILIFGQFVNSLKFDFYGGDKSNKCLKFGLVSAFVNKSVNKYDWTSPIESGDYALTVHRSNKFGSSEYVWNWSYDGSPAFKNINQWNQFIRLCELQEKTKSEFTWTICRRSEFDDFKI